MSLFAKSIISQLQELCHELFFIPWLADVLMQKILWKTDVHAQIWARPTELLELATAMFITLTLSRKDQIVIAKESI